MNRRLALLLYFFFFLTFGTQATGIDSLYNELRSPKPDTVRVDICIKIAKQFEKTNPDSSINWLKKGMSSAQSSKIDIPSDSTLYYYKGVLHTTIALLYVKMGKNMDIARVHLDSGLYVFSQILAKNRGTWIRRKALQGISVTYGMHGKLEYSQGDMSKAIYYFTKALEIQEQLKIGHGVAMMYNNLAALYRQQANYAKSILFYQKALDYFISTNDSIGVASVRVNIGVVSKEIGAFDVALRSYFEALQIFEKSENYSSLASTQINIGDIYSDLSNYTEAKKFYRKAKRNYQLIKDSKGLANSMLAFGLVYSKVNSSDSALQHLSQAEALYKDIGDKYGLALVNECYGDVFVSLAMYKEALSKYNIALTFQKETGTKLSYLGLMVSISKVKFKLGNTSEALKIALLTRKELEGSPLSKTQREIHRLLSEIYEKKGQSNLALYHHKVYSSINDSLFSFERANKLAQMEVLFNISQKEKEIAELEREKKIRDFELSQAENMINSQRFHSVVSVSILVLLLIVLLLLYRQFRVKRDANNQLSTKIQEVQQKNEEIISQKEEILNQRDELEKQQELLKDKSEQLERFNWLLTDSIDYASSIQAALLPSHEIFERYFSDHFIMFFPKDVVSGDFYWAYPMNNTIHLALADCTGHGVPGGFMSMLGISALTELMGRGVTEPSDILNNLRLFVIDSFKQTGRIGDQQDGLDIALISYTKGNSYIEYAGANHSLWLLKATVSEGSERLVEYKADTMPISFFPRMNPYKSHRIAVEPGDQIYIFSDGYRSQLGGDDMRTKFGKERFRKLIEGFGSLIMDDQKNIVEDTFFRWIDGNDQLDDITVIGLKI